MDPPVSDVMFLDQRRSVRKKKVILVRNTIFSSLFNLSNTKFADFPLGGGIADTAEIIVSAGAGRAKLIYVLLRGKRYMTTRAEGSSLTHFTRLEAIYLRPHPPPLWLQALTLVGEGLKRLAPHTPRREGPTPRRGVALCTGGQIPISQMCGGRLYLYSSK